MPRCGFGNDCDHSELPLASDKDLCSICRKPSHHVCAVAYFSKVFGHEADMCARYCSPDCAKIGFENLKGDKENEKPIDVIDKDVVSICII